MVKFKDTGLIWVKVICQICHIWMWSRSGASYLHKHISNYIKHHLLHLWNILSYQEWRWYIISILSVSVSLSVHNFNLIPTFWIVLETSYMYGNLKVKVKALWLMKVKIKFVTIAMLMLGARLCTIHFTLSSMI